MGTQSEAGKRQCLESQESKQQPLCYSEGARGSRCPLTTPVSPGQCPLPAWLLPLLQHWGWPGTEQGEAAAWEVGGHAACFT